VVPSDLRARIDLATPDFLLRQTAGLIARFDLQGLRPSALAAEELARLRESYGEQTDDALQVLVRVGCGERPGRKPRRQREHGVRREQRLRGVIG
jgi:hypothetical protein